MSAARQPHVLLVHYHFLPVHNVAVKRLASYARRLPAFGWEPIVLTRDWHTLDDADPAWGLSWEPELARDLPYVVHRAAAPAAAAAAPRTWDHASWPVRKAAAFGRLAFGRYPDDLVGWVRPAVAAARALARRVRLDAVLSYCPPESNHLVGRRIARALGVPWIPFFGDLWEFFLARFPTAAPGAVLRRLYHRHWMAPAAACIAVSPYMADYLARTYRKPVELVLTGFDPADFPHAGATPAARRARILIAHVGSLYPPDQKPDVFFQGLDRLLVRRPEAATALDVRFVGSKCDAALRRLIDGRPSAAVTTILPKIPSAAALALVRESDVLLAFNCSAYRTRHGTMSHPTKIFEAFGARRPILVVPPDGDWVDALLARTGAGTSARDAGEVATILDAWLTKWRHDGVVPYHGRPDALDAFTLDRQVARLAAVLDAVTGRPRAARAATAP